MESTSIRRLFHCHFSLGNCGRRKTVVSYRLNHEIVRDDEINNRVEETRRDDAEEKNYLCNK